MASPAFVGAGEVQHQANDEGDTKDDSVKSMYWAVVHEGQKASRKPIRSSQDERF